MRPWALALLLVATALVAASAGATRDAGTLACVGVEACPEGLDAGVLAPPAPGPAHADSGELVLYFFWGVGCPHCEAAKPFVDELERRGLRVERLEVRRDPEGRRRFVESMTRLGAEGVGIPAFVAGSRYHVGFSPGATEAEVHAMIAAERAGDAPDAPSRVELPFVGTIDPRSMSLPTLTLVVGLLDGINPCAMWVLLVLLGILSHVRSRARLLLFGGTFVVMSGVVYFTFMTAWSLFFELAGLSRAVTVGLGLVVLAMGLVNLKELVWFKRGVSLTIPDRAKPSLFRRMRAIAAASSVPAAFAGVLVLAFVVNLVELGCTLGLPAVYTRVLSMHGLSAGARAAYLALYNVVYVVPLAAIVAVYGATMHRLVLSERGAKVLKGVSGVMLVIFGLLFVLRPEVLG